LVENFDMIDSRDTLISWEWHQSKFSASTNLAVIRQFHVSLCLTVEPYLYTYPPLLQSKKPGTQFSPFLVENKMLFKQICKAYVHLKIFTLDIIYGL
jgi:hypothetical protein